jgi:hypothetical protein
MSIFNNFYVNFIKPKWDNKPIFFFAQFNDFDIIVVWLV